MVERSGGKDSTTGHWELAGCIVQQAFPVFPHGFPADLMDRFLGATGAEGYLGNTAASGTRIIEELGEEHLRTLLPIVYTSADSVFQIAAHEEAFGLERLHELCRITRASVCVGAYAVGRVIARPFVGSPGSFVRTAHRRDYSLPPPSPTLLDVLSDSGVDTVGVGKVDDLFAGRGLKASYHTTTNADGIRQILQSARTQGRGLIFANLGDFDTLYGHRNDPAGMARALEAFDQALPAVIETLGAEDVLAITADHGNDPVTASTDHSREYVPLLVAGPGIARGLDLGCRPTFADLGQTLADVFGVGPLGSGESFCSVLWPGS